MTAPPFAYFGGKTILAERIAATFPPHGHYVEPFGGSLAVLLAKPPSPMETVNDLDGDLMLFWRVLRDRSGELERVCALTPHSRSEWEACADLEVPDELERARRVWTRLVQGRAGRLVRTGWRHYVNPTSSPSTAFPGYLDGYVDRMATAARRLHHVTLECRPALELVERYGAHDDVLLYVDPPYLGSTRGYDKAYRHEMKTEAEHRDLAEALHRCKAAVVLSGYASDLYDLELYPDWHREMFASGTGQGPNGWSNRTEVLWINREPHPTLFSAAPLFTEEPGGAA